MRLLFVLVLVVLAGCSRPPSSPTSPPPAVPVAFADFSGYWGGTFAYEACLGLHCSGRAHRDDPFSLRLRQSANHVTGVFAGPGGSVRISGDVQPDGSLVLEGFEATGGSAGYPNEVTFSATGLRLDPVLGLTGAMRFQQRAFVSTLDVYPFVADGAIVSAARQNLDAYIADLSGTWKGFFVVRQCVEDTGRPVCDLFRTNEVEFLEMTVSVAGGSASGELAPYPARIPVTGSARGRTIDLEGTRGDAGRITLSGTVDEFGRLNGRFTYRGTSGGRTSTAEVDLAQVIKVQ